MILDEYDSAIMRLMYEPEQLEAMRTMLREFYQVLKDEGAYLRFVFITGVTKLSMMTSGCTRNSSSELGSSSLAQKFSQLSIFSELNNLTQISMYDEYSGLWGITQEELNTVLRPCVEEYAQTYDSPSTESADDLKEACAKKIRTSWDMDKIEFSFESDMESFDIGDVLSAKERVTGISVTSDITKKIVTISNSETKISYKIGE